MELCDQCGLRRADHGDAAVDHAFKVPHLCQQCFKDDATPGDDFCSDYCRDEYDRQIAGVDDGGEG